MDLPTSKKQSLAAPLAAIRTFILIILILALVGTGVELMLVDHTEDFWQLIPLLLITLSCVSLLWHTAIRRAVSMRIFQAIMILFIISGGVGTWLHYQAKVEFKLETNPSLAGMELFWAAIKGVAPPALAPGMMIQMGLLGLAYTYRHPALRALHKDESTTTGE
jgi:hypothetical protein